MGFGAVTTSCEDMLTPDMNRYAEGFSGKDTIYFYTGILRNVQDMIEQNQLLGDLRSDLVAPTAYVSDSVSGIINYDRTNANANRDGDNGLLNRSAYYKVINQCNFYLAKVDTSAVKNNIYYMKREYAQVVDIRAWAYIQLVQTYGRVPFISKPVDNADTGWETNPEGDKWATADNLVDLLKGDLERANAIEHTLGYPQYGEFSTGNDNFKVNSSYLRFYSDIILGDLYLFRGASKQDYVEAAKNYYYFLKEQSRSGVGVTGSYATFGKNTNSNGSYSFTPNIGTWVSRGLAAASLTTENVTLLPSAANSTFGRVMTKVAQIYGFDSNSTNSTSSSGSTSGKVSLTVNYKSRQVEPSKAYLNLCAAQNYSVTTSDRTTGAPTSVEYYSGAGDARLAGTAPIFETKEGGRNRYIVKDAPVTNVNASSTAGNYAFKHYKSIYRLKQIYLRYAEAINRAGYPRLAYAVLNTGLTNKTVPELGDSIAYDDVAQTKQLVYYVDSAKTTTPYHAAFFIGVDELRRAKAEPEYAKFLDFTSTNWSNVGIHELGTGQTSTMDSLNSFRLVVYGNTANGGKIKGRITQEQERCTALAENEAQNIKRRVRLPWEDVVTPEEGEGTTTPSLEEQRKEYTEIDPVEPLAANPAEINAVETLIADEYALETAYEGTRMFDLIRIARHMNLDSNTAADYGTKWLAWKIARRNFDGAPYETPATYDGALYAKLLDENNWYIISPVYK